jgi:hypothetical protein
VEKILSFKVADELLMENKIEQDSAPGKGSDNSVKMKLVKSGMSLIKEL